MPRKHANTPPYVPRAGFRAVLDQIQSCKPGEVLQRDHFHKRGLSSHLIYPAIAALRYLGLIDDKDAITGKHVAYSRESPDLEAQKALVREAYGDFFAQVPLPSEDMNKLKGRFQAIYELSDRVVNSAFPLFQYLVQEAGIPMTGQGVHAPILEEPRKPVHELKESDLAAAEAQGGDEALLNLTQSTGIPLRVKHTGYQVVLNLNVNKYTTEKDILKMIRTANRAIHLARKAGDTH